MAVLSITDSVGHVAQIDLTIDQRGNGHAKWNCRMTSGAFCDRSTLDERQEATVKWSSNSNDDVASTVCCYLDVWGDGCSIPCLELEDVYNQGIHGTGSSGAGTILLSRGGFMAEGDVTWQFVRLSGGELYEDRR